MEPREYKKLADYERWFWWYRAEREVLFDAVRHLNLPAGALVLDAGCGSGQTLIELRRALDIRAHGVDRSNHAAALWNGDAGVHRCVGSINELPYAPATFDCVLSVDVLECKQVDPGRAFDAMARVLRPGGSLVVLAPAFQFLLSTHDAAVHSVKRFRRGEFRALAARAGLTVQRCVYLFPAFFPIVAATRLAKRLRAEKGTAHRDSDLSPLPRWLNALLLTAARVERRVARVVGAPFGSTVMLVATKEGVTA